MARPYLHCPQHWLRATLEPDPTMGLIDSVETGGTPNTTTDAYWNGDYPWLTPKDITNHDSIYVADTSRAITLEGLRNSSAKLVPPGTVLLTKRAPIGTVVVNAIPMATNQGFLNFTCGPHLRPVYFAYWLRANRPYLDLVANGSTYPELYVNDLFEFELSVPPIDIQDRIIDILNSFYFVSTLDYSLAQVNARHRDIVTARNRAKRLHQLINDLMPALLSGQLSISNTLVDTDTV